MVAIRPNHSHGAELAGSVPVFAIDIDGTARYTTLIYDAVS
jgi:hypothetical protein